MFYTLTTSDSDYKIWEQLLETIPDEEKDIHLDPDHAKIYEQVYKDKVYCHALVAYNQICMQVTAIRKINSTGYIDAASIYCYGGPAWSYTVKFEFIKEFADLRTQWMKEKGIISEVAVIKPVKGDERINTLVQIWGAEKKKQVSIVDLRKSYVELWASIDEKQRKSISNLKKKGVKIEIMNSPNDYKEFNKMYQKTMVRVGASNFWKFPDNYFEECKNYLGEKNITLLGARYKDKICGYALFIHKYRTVYYHFSCSDQEEYEINPTNLILFESIYWSKQNGFESLHLGGGTTNGQDKLYRFKLSMAGEAHDIYWYKSILDNKKYYALCKSVEEKGEDSVDYFPKYRSR